MQYSSGFPRNLILLGLSASACMTPTATDEDDQTTVDTAEINGNSSLANAFQRARAIKIPGCTATRIAPRHAITAAHCAPSVGDTVYLYGGGPGFAGSQKARIEQVTVRPGVSMTRCHDDEDCDDSEDHFADMAIIRLSADAAIDNALSGARASLAWKYPGDSRTGTKVGAGAHNGASNPTGILRQVNDSTDDSDDSGGYFVTSTDGVDGGDSGGPFYFDKQIVGTLWGHGIDPLDGAWAKYTSVPYHLDWILTSIGYRWTGSPKQPGKTLAGHPYETVYGTEKRTQYACEVSTACLGYVYYPDLNVGTLYDSVTGTAAQSNANAALKHGVRAGNSGEVVGYLRSDGTNVVVHKNGTAVNELYLGSNWKVGTISSNAPAAASKLSAYRRADGVNAVVYRSTSNRIIELALVNGQWAWFDLTGSGAAPAGNPVAYVGADGVSAVVYRSANGHINELRHGTRAWIATDLTAQAGSTIVASSDPSATMRSDGYSSVVFRGGTGIYELYKAPGGAWALGGISNLAGNAPAAASRPFGYTHHDGYNAVVYRSTANQIVELWLDGAGWHAAILSSTTAAGDPVAYVRSDGVDAVLFRSGTQVYELTNTPWQAWNLSNTGLPTVFADPSVYIRSDGYNSVVSNIAGNDVSELFYKQGTNWGWSNLSAIAGE